MEAYKQEFIKFMVESDVLKFGSFTLKSGRQSPFFMNAGAYVTGYQLKKLGEYYAQAIHDNFGDDFDVLFGPAYKGIPLAVVTTVPIRATCWVMSPRTATVWSWSRTLPPAASPSTRPIPRSRLLPMSRSRA